MESSALDTVLQNNQLAKDGGQLKFSEARVAMNSMSWFDAAVFAEARSMVDWNARNKVLHQFHAWEDRVLISPISFVRPVVHPYTRSGLGGSSHARPYCLGKQKQEKNRVLPRSVSTTFLTPEPILS